MTQTSIEQDLNGQVASIWAEVLDLQTVDEADDFFALGGDSVMAMAVLLQVEERFGVFVDPAELFDAPVLSAFAQRIDALISNRVTTSEVEEL